jgi:hypothetical protein
MAGPDLVSVALGNVSGSPAHILITPSSCSFQQFVAASASEIRQIPSIRPDIVWHRYEQRGFFIGQLPFRYSNCLSVRLEQLDTLEHGTGSRSLAKLFDFYFTVS